MLSFIIKALIDNNFNNSTQSQQTHNNFYSVEFQPATNQTFVVLLLCL